MSRVDHVMQIATELEQAILSGKLAPGDLLPSERRISATRGVSRSVVREALGRLASLGLVRSVHGSGTRVEAPSSRPVTMGYQRLLTRANCRLEDLATVRLPLETAIAARAAEHRTEADLERLEQTQQVLGKPPRPLEAHVVADVEFHAALADATGNSLFRVVLAPIQQLLIGSRRRTLRRYGSEIAFQHHGEILDAVRARDAGAATVAMRRHLEANLRHLHEAAGNVPPPI
jgi:GntR family transcriptional repressor for pyruvate dehydrogenase complex